MDDRTGPARPAILSFRAESAKRGISLRIACVVALLVVLCVSRRLSAGGDDRSPVTSTDKTLALFETRYRAAKALSAVFLEQFIDNGKLVRKEAGRAYFLHPGKMRWDYEAPEKNMFLVDGKYVWFYSPKDHTATRMPTKKSEDWRTPLAFLTSDMKLSRICVRVEADSGAVPSEAGDRVFRCTMKTSQDAVVGILPTPEGKPYQGSGKAVRSSAQAEGGPAKDSVVFELSPEGELRQIKIAQEGRIELEFTFNEWQWNPRLSKGWFEFSPPMGVAIVDGVLPDQAGLRQ